MPSWSRLARSPKLEYHEAPLNSVVFSPDGKYLATAGDDGKIVIVSSSGVHIANIKTKQASVIAVKWLKIGQHRDWKMIVSSGSDGTVKLWTALDGKAFRLSQSVTVSELAIEDMDVFQSKLAVVGRGGMFFYDIRPYAPKVFEPAHCSLKGVVRGKIQTDPGRIRSVRFINNGQGVIVGMFNNVLLAWDLPSNRLLFRHQLETRIGHMDWSEEGRTLAIWNMDDGIDLYKIEGAFVPVPDKITLKIKRNYVIQVQFIDAETLVVGSDIGQVLILNVATRSVVKKLNHDDFVRKLVQAVGGCQRTVEETGLSQYLVASGSSEKGRKGTIRVWSTFGPAFAPRSWRSVVASIVTWVAVVLITSLALAAAASSAGCTLPEGSESDGVQVIRAVEGCVYRVARISSSSKRRSGGKAKKGVRLAW